MTATAMTLSDLRQAVIDALIAADVAGGSIGDTTMTPHDADDETALPHVEVYTLEGSGNMRSQNAPVAECEATVAIECYATGDTDAAIGAALSGLLQACLDAVMESYTIAEMVDLKRYDYRSQHAIDGAERLGSVVLRITFGYIAQWVYTFPNDLTQQHVAVACNGHDLTEETTI